MVHTLPFLQWEIWALSTFPTYHLLDCFDLSSALVHTFPMRLKPKHLKYRFNSIFSLRGPMTQPILTLPVANNSSAAFTRFVPRHRLSIAFLRLTFEVQLGRILFLCDDLIDILADYRRQEFVRRYTLEVLSSNVSFSFWDRVIRLTLSSRLVSSGWKVEG